MLSKDHVHMMAPIPPSRSVSDVVRRMKGRSLHKIQREFPDLKKRQSKIAPAPLPTTPTGAVPLIPLQQPAPIPAVAKP